MSKSRKRDKARAVEYARRHRDKIRKAIQEIKESRPCADCGKFFPYYIMDFDHVRGEKKYDVSRMINGNRLSMETVLLEIAKCDVVCANDHRRREHARKK